MQSPRVGIVASSGRNCSIRLMTGRDIPGVEEIYREAFPTSFPLPPFANELRNPDSIFLVATSADVNRFAESLPSSENVPSNKLLVLVTLTLNKIKSALVRAFRLEGSTKKKTSILGFVGISLIDEAAHITSIASHFRFRGMGIGELLLIGTVEVALFKQLNNVTLEVRVGNEIAQSLYRKYGFKDIGIRKRYYLDNGEDALIMTTDPITTPSYKCLFSDLLRRDELRWGGSVRKFEPQ